MAVSAAASSTVLLSKSAPVEPSPHPILSGVRVRRAIAYCTDKAALIESVYPDLTPEERQDQRKAHYATFIELFAEDVPSIPLFLRSPASEGIWEHIDFNLQTFLQQTEISPTFEATLNFTDYHGNAGSIEIPAGAVSSPMSLGFRPLVSASHPAPDGLASPLSFRLDAFVDGAPQESFTFLEPVTLTLPYSPEDLGEIYSEESLDLLVLDDFHWQIAADSCPPEERYQSLDTTANQIIIRFCHLSEFSLMGTRAYPVYLPLVDH